MKLWILSELYYPEDTSTGYFVTHIAESLAKDFDVNVVCSQPTYSERHLKASRHEQREGVRIKRVFSTRFNKDSILGRIVNMATFTVSCALAIFLMPKRGDHVLVLTNPPTLPPIVAIISRIKGLQPSLLMHDVYPELLEAVGAVSSRSLLYRTAFAAMRATLAQYRSIVVLGRDMAVLTKAKLRENSETVKVIPNWGATDRIFPIDEQSNQFAQEHNLAGKTVIQMAGNLGRTHDIELVLQVAETLSSRDDIIFQFIGYGGKASKIKKQLDLDVSDNVRFLDRQPRERLGQVLARADASIIPFVSKMKGISVPSRMYDVMAAGTPIIAVADVGSELSMVVSEENCGWCVPTGDAQRLRDIIENIADDPAEAKKRGLLGRSAAEKKYNIDAVTKQFKQVFAA